MTRYTEYLNQIKTRKTMGLGPKPIEDGDLIKEIIDRIKNESDPL